MAAAIAAANDPADMLGALVYEDFDPASGVTTEGGAVSSWIGKVLGIDVTQGTGTAQPTHVASGMDSLPHISFDGGDKLEATGLTDMGGATFAIWAVAKASSSNKVIGAVSNGSTVSCGFQRDFSGNWDGQVRAASLETIDGPAADTSAHIHVVRLHSSIVAQYIIDGTAYSGTLTGNMNTSTTVCTVGALPNGTQQWVGTISRLVLLRGDVSNADLNTLGNWAAAKWTSCSWSDL